MMGLPKALAAHASNDLAVAMREYQRAFDQDIADSRLYQNYGSLLAKSGKVKKLRLFTLRVFHYFQIII